MSSITGGIGSVVSLWRYPVKSMMGEELNAAHVTERGLVGDRQCALIDRETGKVVSAKNPRKWGDFFSFRAAFVEPPTLGSKMPAVRITLPDGTTVTSEQAELALILSRALGREVRFEQVAPSVDSAGAGSGSVQAEGYWPDMDGLDHRDTVTDFDLPEGTFFDSSVVHVLTTATLDRLRELYPGGHFEVRRFRPNIVVTPDSAQRGFVENEWVGRTLAIGDDVRLHVTGPCPRCVMTTLPQGDLPKDPGILRAAAQHNGANVGLYASVERGGLVSRGDTVKLL